MKTITRNNLYILKLWFIPGVFCVFMGLIVLFTLTQAFRGDFKGLFHLLILTGVTSAIVYHTRMQAIREFEHLLRKDNASEVIEYYESKLKGYPNSNCMMIAASSLVAAFYGETKRAREIIELASFTDKIPLLKAQAMQSLAYISYIEGEICKGLELADTVTENSKIFSFAPGHKMMSLAASNCKNMGIVLLGKEDDETVAELYDGFKKLPLPGKVVSAWGLSIALYRLNKYNESDRMKHFIISKTPNFHPIIQSIEMATQIGTAKDRIIY
ncbi:MAG: hypothetical protein R2941_06425 [Desulfobacterales bacterium]